MNKNISTLVYFFASLTIIAFFAKSLTLLIERENYSMMDIEQEVYLSSEGVLKYASGNCSQNFDCMPAGCSSEICSSEGVFSACIAIDEHPAELGYSCSCYKNKCAWIK